MSDAETGRWQQRKRTRKDLLQAAVRLMREGRTPSLEEVADEAQVSRATAYRYFPNAEALLIEAPLDVATPEPETMFAGDASEDPVERLNRADAALHGMIVENEPALRVMLANALRQSAKQDTPVRQDRRTPLIEAALAPARARMKPADYAKLKAALALVIGTESRIVFRDVLGLDDAQAQRVRRWAIRALVDAALK